MLRADYLCDPEHECNEDGLEDSPICTDCGEHAGFCSECGMSSCCGAGAPYVD